METTHIRFKRDLLKSVVMSKFMKCLTRRPKTGEYSLYECFDISHHNTYFTHGADETMFEDMNR